ncbi:MAG: aminotransferase class I/II-fold pyridoxal phosphate-dependent enzyme [Terriglobales bacterium]
MRHRHSDYMLWAKTQGRAKFNLATSGVGPFPLHELQVTIDQLEINGDSTYGYTPLQHAIAKKCGVDPDCVVAAAGTSMANHLAMATLIDPGDEVVIEQPTYELLTSTLLYLGAAVKTFIRDEANGYALDPAEVRRAITPRTKLIVLTNLHNPSSVLVSDSVLREIGELARSIGARVLVDEVYLDAVYTNTPKTAYLLGPEFIVTSSLTKVYGLSGLRCGWILAEPGLALAMWRLNDLFASIPAHPAELLSVVALENLDQIRGRARKIVEADRALLRDFLTRQNGISAPQTEFGTTAILRLAKGNVNDFLARLRTEYETSAVPGHFFGLSNHFRIGMGVDTEMFREGLQRISQALSPG